MDALAAVMWAVMWAVAVLCPLWMNLGTCRARAKGSAEHQRDFPGSEERLESSNGEAASQSLTRELGLRLRLLRRVLKRVGVFG